MVKKKKTFSRTVLKDALADARVRSEKPRVTVLRLFELMETEAETAQRKQLEKPAAKPKVAPSPKRRSLPKVASAPKAVSKPKTKPKPAG